MVLTNWSNGLSLNTNKCNVISFYERNNLLFFDYFINSDKLNQDSVIKDFGVLFDTSVTFELHINYIVSKSFNLQAAGVMPIGITSRSSHITSPFGTFCRKKIFKVRLGHIHKYAGRLQVKQLGFIKRTTTDFTDIAAIIHLYKSLILLNFLYCRQIWSPFTRELINRLESCQYCFLRYLSFKTNNPLSRFEHDFTETALHFKLQTKKSLQYFHVCSLMFKILRNSF